MTAIAEQLAHWANGLEAGALAPTLRATLQRLLLDAGGYRWPGLYWNAADKVGDEFSAGDRVNIVFRLTRSRYNQMETLQLTILDRER